MSFFGGGQPQEPQGPDPVYAAKVEMEMYTGMDTCCVQESSLPIVLSYLRRGNLDCPSIAVPSESTLSLMHSSFSLAFTDFVLLL